MYADWLDENGRPAHADFLRTELELAKLPLDSPAAPPLRERLWQAWAGVDATWLHRFTQPNVLRANPTPFPAEWRNFGLGELRPADGTYGGWPYESIPPLPTDQFLGSFGYLGEPPALGERSLRYAGEHLARLARLTDSGLRLPPPFTGLMGDFPRLAAFRSVTDCYFRLPGEEDDDPVRPALTGSGTHVIFYADSQYCLLWDLFVHPTGASCVVVRNPDYFYDPELHADEEEDAANPPDTGPRAWFVASSFEAFVHRVWVENQVWYLQHSDFMRGRGHDLPPVTPAIQEYIDHYRGRNG